MVSSGQHKSALGSRAEQLSDRQEKSINDRGSKTDDEIRRAFGTDESKRNNTTKKQNAIMSIEEYRKELSDFTSTDEKIVERIVFMEAMCRNVIRIELEKVRELYEKANNT